jgi:acetyl-CoA C-acetyltransferase
MLVLMSEKAVQERKLSPLAEIVGIASAGVPPEIMGIGPVAATRKLLANTKLSISDFEVIEANEAFAVQALAVQKELELPPSRVNPNGGAIALGHPIGASGARILVTLVHELKRTQGTYGLATLCIGGGQGIALAIKRC